MGTKINLLKGKFLLSGVTEAHAAQPLKTSIYINVGAKFQPLVIKNNKTPLIGENERWF